MGHNSTRIALYTHVRENWTATPVVYGEHDKAGDNYMKTGTPFLYVYISWGDEVMKSLISEDTALYEGFGILAFRIFTKVESGEAIIDQFTDSLKSIFRSKSINGVLIERMNIDRDGLGIGTGKIWNARYLSFVFSYNTIETLS